MRSCPFCCAEIPKQAKKCQYCGEWLNGKQSRTDPSAAARAVNRGLKQKEIDDWWFSGCLPKITVFFMIIVYWKTDSLGWMFATMVVFSVLGTIAYLTE